MFIQRERFISGVAGNDGKTDHVVWKMTEKCQIGDHDQSVTDGLSVGKGFKMWESINLPVSPEEIQCACHYNEIVQCCRKKVSNLKKERELLTVHKIRIKEEIDHFLEKRIIDEIFQDQKMNDCFSELFHAGAGGCVHIIHRKKTAKEDGQKAEQVHAAYDRIFGHREEHEGLPDTLRHQEIVLNDIIIADISGQIENHGKDGQGIKKHRAQQIFCGSVLVTLKNKKHDKNDKNSKKIEHNAPHCISGQNQLK